VGVLGINHIAFRTPDADRLRGFYLELLGAEALYLRDPDGRRLEITYNDHGAFWRE